MPDIDEFTYKIVRHFLKREKETLKTGLTLEEAQAHCEDPETSSKTAVSVEADKLTREAGSWFDGYYRE